jgi:hypothetical protein
MHYLILRVSHVLHMSIVKMFFILKLYTLRTVVEGWNLYIQMHTLKHKNLYN